MLLEKLLEYSKRLNLDSAMYQKTRIRWLIDLDRNGQRPNIVPTTQGEGKNKVRGKEFSAPHIGRSSGIKAKLLADTGEYVLGIARERDKQSRVNDCHQAFLKEVRSCADSTNEPTVKSVLRFLEEMNPATLQLPQDFKPGDNLTFRVDGELPIYLESVQEYWATNAGAFEEQEQDEQAAVMECLLCGEFRTAVKRHQFKIKRIPGGQSAGLAMISANVPAFESYGLEASLVAPTCQMCGEHFTKAANALIEDDKTHITIGPLVYIFWTKEETAFNIASLLSSPDSEEVKALINSAFAGKQSATKLDPTPFYATAFSASGGRVVVRDWLETTVEAVKRNLGRWFWLQAIVGEWGEIEASPFPIQGYLNKDAKKWVHGLAESVVPLLQHRRSIKDVNPNVPRVLLQTALKGSPLPPWLLSQIVARNVAEQGVTRSRAALIKAVLLSCQTDFPEEDQMVKLDSDNKEPAYLCGRLLAVLEIIQRQAIPGTKATITDRFYGTASSAPASVFPRLIRGSAAHLGKLRKDRRGVYEALQKQMEDIIHPDLKAFPKILTMQEQGLFALGYYHQRAEDRASARSQKANTT